MCDVLAEEVKHLGIRVLNVLPGGLRTANWDKMILLPTSPTAVHSLPFSASSSSTVDSTTCSAAEAVADAVGAAEPKLMTGDADPVPADAQHIPDYAELRAARVAWALKQSGMQPGCAGKSASVIVDVVCGGKVLLWIDTCKIQQRVFVIWRIFCFSLVKSSITKKISIRTTAHTHLVVVSSNAVVRRIHRWVDTIQVIEDFTSLVFIGQCAF